jgi:hypothetical protein
VKVSGFGWAVIGALALILLMHWFSGRGRDAELALARMREDSLRSVTDSLKAAHLADSLAAAAVTQRFADSLVIVDRRLVAARDRAARTAAAIAASSDTMIPRREVLQGFAENDSVIAVQEVKIATLAADTVAWRGRWLQAASEASSWRQVALDAQAQLSAANKRGRPRWGCAGGVTGLAGGGLTAGQGTVVGGPTVAVGLGVTCGLRL